VRAHGLGDLAIGHFVDSFAKPSDWLPIREAAVEKCIRSFVTGQTSTSSLDTVRCSVFSHCNYCNQAFVVICRHSLPPFYTGFGLRVSPGTVGL
jgi:hypothetical protein